VHVRVGGNMCMCKCVYVQVCVSEVIPTAYLLYGVKVHRSFDDLMIVGDLLC